MPRIRFAPEDFRVEEKLLYPLDGSGPHAYLQIEKRLSNTDDIARSLAEALGIARREVGYAGRKDRVAVTRQWFSVPGNLAERVDTWEHPGARIVDRDWHSERLRVGQLSGNRFRLRVRDVDDDAGKHAAERLEILSRLGMPNRFGRQRFGRDGRNAERGARILAKGRIRGNRRKAWLMLSALQSAVFNRVLELRQAPLDALLTGDVAFTHATGETFLVGEPPDPERLARFELSPTGPMFGTKMLWPRGETVEVERQAMVELGLNDPRRLDLPRGLRLFGDRRPLRVQPRAAHSALSDDELLLEFELPAGSYATVLLEELFPGGFEEGSEAAGTPPKPVGD
ncbi:MAG: tRNA pseudouridine(13) synthase TruD [Acidobacteriota bacterium]